MIIGSMDVVQIDNSMYYTICNINTHTNSSFFLLLIQSLLYINPNIKHDTGTGTDNRLTTQSIYTFPHLHCSHLHCSHFIKSLDEFILSNPFTIDTANLLLQSLYTQIHFFNENNIAISFIDLNDIMTVDGTQFYFCNTDKMYTMKKNKSINITRFYDVNNHFIPPEFVQNLMMPFSSYYTSSFYSLAIIILFCLHYSHNMSTNELNNVPSSLLSSINKPVNISVYQYLLDKYKHSKIYYSLMQCIIQDPIQRKLFIL